MRRIILKVAVGVLAAATIGAAGVLGVAFAPTLFGYESLIVRSGSMGHAMPTGSVAITKLVDFKTVGVGDIVSFRHPEADLPTTHRIVDIDEQDGRRVLTTKGDANASADPNPLVLGSGRIARVERVVPYAGYLVRGARTPAGGLVLFLVPILGLVVDRRQRRNRPSNGRARHRADQPSLEAVLLELAAAVRALSASASRPSEPAFREAVMAALGVAGSGRPRESARPDIFASPQPASDLSNGNGRVEP
jgi:signal peptidase